MVSVEEPADAVMADATKEAENKRSATSSDVKDLKTAAQSQEEDEEIESDDPNEAPPVTQGTQATQNALKQKASGKQPFTDYQAEQAIASFMEKNNRPYSVQDVLNSYQHQLRRTQCMKIMDQMVESQILTCKEYGKAKVYLINQDMLPQTNQEQLDLLDQQVNIRRVEYEKLTQVQKAKQNELKQIQAGGDTNTAIAKSIELLKEQILQAEARLRPFQESGANQETEDDLESAERELQMLNQRWKRQKRACMDAVGIISESIDMNRRTFAERVGIDTDEDVQMFCPI